MTIEQKSEGFLTELLKESYEAPDFNFLEGWPQSESFIPRVNGMEINELDLKGHKRAELEKAIDQVARLNPLIVETNNNLRLSQGSFSDSISVFHKDGDVSVVAIPVNSTTLKSLSGFLLAKELTAKNGATAKRFLQELKDLPILADGAKRALKARRWWKRLGENELVDLRRASQLLIAANTVGPSQLSRLVQILEKRISITDGSAKPTPQDWQQAILHLEALKDLPKNAVISSISIDNESNLTSDLESIAAGFHRMDERKENLRVALDKLKVDKIKRYSDSYLLSDFSNRVKGSGFPRKAVEKLILECRLYRNETSDSPVSIGEVLSTAYSNRGLFRTKSLKFGLKLLEDHFEDQKALLGYPRLTDSGEAFDDFLVAAHELKLEQERPYPVRTQFEVLHKLLKDEPNELHLIARNSGAVKKLIGSLKLYSDPIRRQLLSAEPKASTVEDAREFFRSNPANFQSVLSNLGFNALSLEQMSGFLAPTLTKKIRDIDLDLAGMKSELRSYQRFGAQYALYQERVILGDEMGLGKTITALALAKHLSNEGAQRILVTVPLAVLENWRREVLKHTDYEPRILYGETLDDDLKIWSKEGGLALATFESVQKVNSQKTVESLISVDLTIVDEAHFLKNPKTKRAQAVLPWLKSSDRALMMTGTPLENSLDEFITLISYVQPNLELPEDNLAHSKFRKAIAPVYLRRNQVDVLQELPELQDEEDFIELSEADVEYYRRALANSDWHQSRRARVLAGDKSSTVQRIKGIVEESMASGDKVLIFSYYLETIEVLRHCLKEDDAYKPITGALNSFERQVEVDNFTNSKEPGVLLAQSTAGGTGLNIQAASVVIIVEPQSKPSLEDQMVGRVYRMGQTKPVRVIRLRGKNTLDERWVAMLQEKRKIFSATAAISDAATLDSAMSTVNTSDLLEEERKTWDVKVI